MTNALGDRLERAREAAATASERLREASATARENAAVAYDSSREAAEAIKERSTKVVQENPLAVVAGGLAVGMLLGALWPKSTKHGRASSTLTAGLLAARGASLVASGELARAGGKLREKIGGIDTDAAKAKFSEIAQIDRAREKLSDALEKATDAVSTAGKTAAERLRRKN